MPQGNRRKVRQHDASLEELHWLRTALEPFVDLKRLRRVIAEHEDVYSALRSDTPPAEVRKILEVVEAMLTPRQREQIKSPSDVAALLMVQMGGLEQEELRTVLLDTKNRVQDIVTVYRGSVNQAQVRVAELFKEAVRRNSVAVILAHNHPSGDPTPSPEDILVTRNVVEAGKLLDVEVLDHLILTQGRWVSLRERGLGFSS